MFGIHKMGSYAVYGGTGAAGVMVKQNSPTMVESIVQEAVHQTASSPTLSDPKEAETFLGNLVSFINEEIVSIVDGRVYIWDISALDIGSMILITFSVMATLIKAYYDYTDWRDRRLARAAERHPKTAEVPSAETASMGAGSSPAE